MKTFGTLDANDYVVEDYFSHAPISWELMSSSNGSVITFPEDLIGSVTVQRAKVQDTGDINVETGTYEHLLHASVKHLFYDRGQFLSGSIFTTESVTPLADHVYVVSVGQNFYGDRLRPGSFEFAIDNISSEVKDDGYGNLYVSQSGTGSYVGNIFYKNGIAVITHDTGSVISSVGGSGIHIAGGSEIYVDYNSEVLNTRHEANVRLLPYEFNFSPFNPSITYQTVVTGSATQSLNNIPSSSVSASAWNLYNLMGAGAIKPYVTSIGLYNDQYELLAVAKLANPIQRTFDIEQIFIVRFDT